MYQRILIPVAGSLTSNAGLGEAIKLTCAHEQSQEWGADVTVFARSVRERFNVSDQKALEAVSAIRLKDVGGPRGLFALWLLVLTMLVQAVAAEGLVPVPPLQTRLTDLTGTLTAEQQTGLEQSLRAFETRKGTQIAVLIVPKIGRAHV